LVSTVMTISFDIGCWLSVSPTEPGTDTNPEKI